jgi:hypothetical protein
MNNHKTIVTHAGIQSAINYLCDGDDRITAGMIGSGPKLTAQTHTAY